ncbi:MAG: bifunctional demethylmenaquinone methyltransferase/2-methoxy-6-polyprenyl-1,4-benzoquinol methylase UbiE [Pseudanabaenaceae cyanobacterium]
MSVALQNLFNRIAVVYDRLNDQLSLGNHRLWKKMAVKLAQPQVGQIWLDLCCGSGDIAGLLAKQVGTTGRVIGLDFAAQQLAIARQKFRDANICWQLGDALNLPFFDATFDGVIISYGLRNVDDINLCLREIYRVLKPNAKLVALDFHRPYNALMAHFQKFYLENIVVPTARKYQLAQEYAYILPSLEKFPQGKMQTALALQAGFQQAIHYPIAGEMMGVLIAVK